VIEPVEGRLHPLVALLGVGKFVRVLGPTALAGGFVFDVSLAVAIPVVAVGLFAGGVFAVFAWWRFHYRVRDGRLEVSRGVFVRRERVVPLERIRGVALDQPLVHRVFGLVRARVDAAAAGDVTGELVLGAITRKDAERLRDAVVGESVTGGAPEPAVEIDSAPLVQMGPAMLLLYGATSPRYILVPAGLALGAVNFLEDLGLAQSRDDDVSEFVFGGPGRAIDRLQEVAPGHAASWAGLSVGVLAVVVVVAGLGSLIVDWAFRLRADGTRVAIDHGLLARRQTTVERRRLLGVETVDSPWRRLLGVGSSVAPIGGVSPAAGEWGGGRVRLVPLARRESLVALEAEFAPGAPALEGHPRAGLVRRVVRAGVIPMVGVIAAFVAGDPWLAAGAGVATLVMLVVAIDRHRNLGHAFGRRLVLRSGSLARRRSVIAPETSVAYVVRRSPWQRRHGLCTVDVHLGLGAGTRSAIDVADDQAARLIGGLAPWVS
jgi:putative membrane protein